MEKQLINLMEKRDEAGSLQKQCHSSIWVLTGSRSSVRAGLISDGFGGKGRLNFYGSFARGSEIKIRYLLRGFGLVVVLFVGGFKHLRKSDSCYILF